MAAVTEGTILWTPPPQRVEAANITRFARWLGSEPAVRLIATPNSGAGR